MNSDLKLNIDNSFRTETFRSPHTLKGQSPMTETTADFKNLNISTARINDTERESLELKELVMLKQQLKPKEFSFQKSEDVTNKKRRVAIQSLNQTNLKKLMKLQEIQSTFDKKQGNYRF